MLKKIIKITSLTLFAYLLQATVAWHVSLWGAAPNIALAFISAVTVALGRKYTFLMALTIGYLMEIMLPALDYWNLLLYPVAAMLAALLFSDKSERMLEQERTTGNYSKQLNAHLRTVLCALLSAGIFEGVHLFYIYLDGVAIDVAHIMQVLICVAYTTTLAAILQFPIRWWLGIYKNKAVKEKTR